MTCYFAVVPIFVNAGAAVLPAVLAAIASAAALLLKPREIIRIVRDKPLAVMGITLALTALVVGSWAWASHSSTAQNHGPETSTAGFAIQPIDFTQLALQIIAHDSGMDRAARPLWSYTQIDAVFLSSPVMRDGRVYCASMELGPVPSGSIYCLDASSGALIWQTSGVEDDHFHPFFSSPAISEDGKYLVIGQGLHADADCEMLCLETASGKVHWRVKTPLHIESSPAIRGDFAVVGAGAIEGDDHKAIGDPGQVVAVRISDGKELWRAKVNDPESSPAIGPDGVVFIGSGFNGNAVVALRSESDRELSDKKLDRVLWRFNTPYPITAKISVIGDLVLAGGGKSDYIFADPDPAGVVIAVNRTTGKLVWKTDLPDSVLGDLCVTGNRVFCPVRDGKVVALDLHDGHALWSRAVSGKTPLLAGIVAAGDHVCAITRDGTLGLLNPADGSLDPAKLFDINAPGNPGKQGLCYSTPCVAGDRLYVGTETGGLRCFSLQSAAENVATGAGITP